MGGLAARFDCAGKGRTVTFTANYFSPLPPAVDTRKDPTLSLESVRTPPTAGRALKFCTWAIYLGLWLMAISVRRYSPSMDASPAATVGYALGAAIALAIPCLLYTSPSPRDS